MSQSNQIMCVAGTLDIAKGLENQVLPIGFILKELGYSLSNPKSAMNNGILIL